MKFIAIERVVGTVLARHQMDAFDPYQFTPALVDDLVMSCMQGEDDAPEAWPDGSRQSGHGGFWKRLLGGR